MSGDDPGTGVVCKCVSELENIGDLKMLIVYLFIIFHYYVVIYVSNYLLRREDQG